VLAYVAGRCADQLELLPPQERSVDVKVAPPGPVTAPTAGPNAGPKPNPDPAPQSGVLGWFGLAGLFFAALAALLAKVNGLFGEIIKFRDHVLTLLGRKPREPAAPAKSA
jgi:hypothetical protein